MKETRVEREAKRQAKRELVVEREIEEEQKLQIDLASMYSPFSKFTPEFKLNAVMTYVLTGTIKASAKKIGMTQQTLNEWKLKAVWWDDAVAECRKKKQDELDARYTNLIHEIIEQVHDRVLNGDTKLGKDGILVKVPMTGKELVITMAVTFDKRQMLRGEATSRVEKVSDKERVSKLADSFKEMSIKMKNFGFDSKLIEGDTVDEK